MTDSMAEGLSMIGLVAGFPLLLLCFMLSLEKLESWGLGDDAPGTPQPPPDKVDVAVEAVEQMAAAAAVPDRDPAMREPEAVGSERAVAAQRGAGWPGGGPR